MRLYFRSVVCSVLAVITFLLASFWLFWLDGFMGPKPKSGEQKLYVNPSDIEHPILVKAPKKQPITGVKGRKQPEPELPLVGKGDIPEHHELDKPVATIMDVSVPPKAEEDVNAKKGNKGTAYSSCSKNANKKLSWTPMQKEVDCAAVLSSDDAAKEPIRLDGHISVHKQCNLSVGEKVAKHNEKEAVWSAAQLDNYILWAEFGDTNFFYYGLDAKYFYSAFTTHPVKGLAGLLADTEADPWLAAIFLAQNVSNLLVTNSKRDIQIPSTVRQLKFIKQTDLHSSWQKHNELDFVVSYSDVEHLGMQLDEPNNADFLALERFSCLLKPRGLLFLGVPIGQDSVYAHSHRVYGDARLPYLLANWRLLDIYGPGKRQSAISPAVFKAQNSGASMSLLVLEKNAKDTC